MQPNKTNIRTWVDALRSERYTQGTGVLHRLASSQEPTETYCCLGVACAAALDAGVDMTRGLRQPNPAITYDGEAEYLPGRVRHWLGLDAADPRVSTTDDG